MIRTPKLARSAGLLFVSAVVATLSVCIERRGPELVQYSDMCGPAHDQPCMRPTLKGGFPMGFLVDMPGVSVENQLSVGEDQFVAVAFVVDWGVYAAFVWLLFRVWGTLDPRRRAKVAEETA